MKQHRFEECVDTLTYLAEARWEKSLNRAVAALVMKAAMKTFLFQPNCNNWEWSCRCVFGDYYRWGVRPAGSDCSFITVYYDCDKGLVSAEILDLKD